MTIRIETGQRLAAGHHAPADRSIDFPEAAFQPGSINLVVLATCKTSSQSLLMCKSVAYGKCVVAHVEDIQKNLCSKEFRAFKECVEQAVGDDLGGANCVDEETMVRGCRGQGDGHDRVLEGLQEACGII